ncbi:MAG: MerC domain-containing protein [Henriciella sp.]|nr:MerC domain-containing protein [Henriciella sp.]
MNSALTQGRGFDAAAITLSGLCLIHCLALPLLVGVLPLAGVLAEAEWLHRAFVVLAVPLSVYVMARCQLSSGQRAVFIMLASIGLGLLIAGAFVEALHDYETLLTVFGAAMLGGAHIWRWRTCQTCSAGRG